MPPRKYSSQAVETTLNGNISAGATSIVVASVTGFPSTFPYTLVIDKGTSSEELIEVTNAGGTTLTVTRAIDGSTALAHQNAAKVVHAVTARDLREPQDHIYTAGNTHGVTGNLVGETMTQTLTNKTLTAPTIGDFTNANHIHNGVSQGGFVVSPRVRVYRNTVTAIPTGGGWTDVSWEGTDVEDPSSWWGSGANLLCPFNGFYVFAAGCKFRGGTDGSSREISIREGGGGEFGWMSGSQAGVGSWTTLTAVAFINVTGTTNMKLSVKHGDAGDLDVGDFWMAGACLMRY